MTSLHIGRAKLYKLFHDPDLDGNAILARISHT
jgi:hypothetical protein